jgi:hypothetical protein
MRTESLFYSLSLVACKHSETICRYCDSVACGLTSVACGPIFSQSSYEAKPCLPFAYLIPRRVLQQCCSFSLPHLQRVCRSRGCIVTASPSRRSFSTLSSIPCPSFLSNDIWVVGQEVTRQGVDMEPTGTKTTASYRCSNFAASAYVSY